MVGSTRFAPVDFRLYGRVSNSKLIVEASVDFTDRCRSFLHAARFRQDHVAGKEADPIADGPKVKIMDISHRRNAAHSIHKRVDIEILRSAFHEDIGR